MASSRSTPERIVRELMDHVEWPKMRPGERLDVRCDDRQQFMREDVEGLDLVISVARWFPDEPFGGTYREVHGQVDPQALRRYKFTGSGRGLIDAVLDTMRTLALILSAKPPEGWRLFGRRRALPVCWSRLRTRPVLKRYFGE